MPLYNSFVKLLALMPIFVLKDVIKWAKFPRNRYLDGNFLLSLPSEGATLCAPSGDVPDGRYPRRWESAEFPILDLRDCSFPRRCNSAIRLSIREIASSFSFRQSLWRNLSRTLFLYFLRCIVYIAKEGLNGFLVNFFGIYVLYLFEVILFGSGFCIL